MPMKLQIMSDLHLDKHRDQGVSFIRGLNPIDVDLLVLAGDVREAGQYQEMEAVFWLFLEKYRRILYIPGNHEYYRSSPRQVTRNLARLVKEMPEIIIPTNELVVIDGQRFFAGTMWFSYDPIGDLNKRFMEDFYSISDFEPWVYSENDAFKKAFILKVEPGDVVISHHLPARQSIPRQFARSSINPFFLSDMTEYLGDLQPKLWIHGHTHTPCDYMIDKTRVIANPLGYPREIRSLEAFNPALYVEV